MIRNGMMKFAVAFAASISLLGTIWAAEAGASQPNAKVSKLPALTLGSETYLALDGEDSVDRPLQVVMNFKAMETAEEARPNGFLPYVCDFYLTFSGLKDSSFTADNCYLAGNYGTYGWIVIPTDGMVLESDVTYPVLGGYSDMIDNVDLRITYKEICEVVKDFTAAIYIAPDILAANPDFKVKLELKMTNPDNEDEVIVVGSPAIYTVADLKGSVSVKVSDAYDVKFNGAKPNADQAAAVEYIISEFSANANVAAVKTGVDSAANADAVSSAKNKLIEAGVDAAAANIAIPVVSVALTAISGEEDSEAPAKVSFDVSPMVSAGGKSVKIEEFAEPVKFRLPVFSGETKAFAKVYHNEDLMGVYKINGEGTQKYIEVSSSTFSTFTVEPYAYPVKIGETGYDTLAAAVAAAVSGSTIKLEENIELTETLVISADKEDLTIDLNGMTVSGAEGVKISNLGELTIKDSSKEMQGMLDVEFANSGKACLTGGWFTLGFGNEGEIQVSGGAYPECVDRGVIPAGYACSKVGEEEDFVYIVAKLPTATVSPVSDAALKGNELTFALNFKADQASDLQLAAFGHWYADFVLAVNKQVVLNADGDIEGVNGHLSGQYAEWSENWVNVPFGANKTVTMTAGKPLKVMEYAAELMGEKGLKLTYNDVYSFVKEFNCGVFFKPEFLAANPDLKVSLSLKMFNPENENESYVIGIDYEFMPPSENDTVTVRDQNGLIVNCKTMKDAIAAVLEKGDAVNGGEITIVKDSEISEDITITGTRNLFFDIGADKRLTLAEDKKFALSNVNVAFIGAGSLVGFTAANVEIDDRSVLTLPASAQMLAESFEDAGKYVAKNSDGTWSVANKFELQIQMNGDVPAIGFLNDARRTFVIESSSDLVNWTSVDYVETTGYSEVAVPLKWQAPASGQFFRVKAADPAK